MVAGARAVGGKQARPRIENRWMGLGLSPGQISRDDPLGPSSFQKVGVRKCNLTSSAAVKSWR